MNSSTIRAISADPRIAQSTIVTCSPSAISFFFVNLASLSSSLSSGYSASFLYYCFSLLYSPAPLFLSTLSPNGVFPWPSWCSPNIPPPPNRLCPPPNPS